MAPHWSRPGLHTQVPKGVQTWSERQLLLMGPHLQRFALPAQDSPGRQVLPHAPPAWKDVGWVGG